MATTQVQGVELSKDILSPGCVIDIEENTQDKLMVLERYRDRFQME